MAAKALAMSTTEEQGADGHVPFALGGPIFFSDFSGSIKTAKDFQDAVAQELQDLQAELSTIGGFDGEFSVDELRVFTEQELVEKALESLKEVENRSKSTPMSEENVFERESLNDSSMPRGESPLEEKSQKNFKRGKKRGRQFDRDTRASEFENANFNIMEHFARIKQNQDADKAAVRLHSFCGNFEPVPGSMPSKAEVWKLHSLRSITSFNKIKSSDRGQQGQVPYPEVVLCVEVYDSRMTHQKTQEHFVLGSQTLTALRDNIFCSTDQLMKASGQSEPSGYFLIEGTFFNDMRDQRAIDYSEPILEWLVNHRKEAKEKWEFIATNEIKTLKRLPKDLTISDLPHFKSADMDKTRFCDLHFRLGSGYLFCHQGNCRHLVVIRDMRLVHAEDDQNKQSYPLLTFQIRKRQRKCSVCNIHSSTMVTVDDRWAAKNPCFFCKDCYYLLHYKEDGSLLYDNFNVFDLEELCPADQPN